MTIRINQAGNLTVDWEPEGAHSEACDWKRWYRSGQYVGRPSNELLYIRDVGDVAFRFAADFGKGRENWPAFMKTPGAIAYSKQWDRQYKQRHEAIDAALLQAIASLIKSLVNRLRKTFEVRMVTEIEMVWKSGRRKKPEPLTHDDDERLVHWDIVNVEWRRRQNVLQELNKLSAELDRKSFAKAWGEAIGARQSHRCAFQLEHPNSVSYQRIGIRLEASSLAGYIRTKQRSVNGNEPLLVR